MPPQHGSQCTLPEQQLKYIVYIMIYSLLINVHNFRRAPRHHIRTFVMYKNLKIQKVSIGIEFNSATKSKATKSKETRNKILGRENILA